MTLDQCQSRLVSGDAYTWRRSRAGYRRPASSTQGRSQQTANHRPAIECHGPRFRFSNLAELLVPANSALSPGGAAPGGRCARDSTNRRSIAPFAGSLHRCAADASWPQVPVVGRTIPPTDWKILECGATEHGDREPPNT